jgi:hypothetical protein
MPSVRMGLQWPDRASNELSAIAIKKQISNFLALEEIALTLPLEMRAVSAAF